MTRITQRAVNRTYKNAYSKNLEAYTGSMTKIETGRSFSKVSENVAGAARAYKIRKAMSRDNQYLANIADVQDKYESAEDSLKCVNDYLQTAQDRLVQAQGTTTEDEWNTIATEIEALAQSVLQSVNNETSGVYVFGGNKNEAPFAWDPQTKKLTWRSTGVEINDISDRLGSVNGVAIEDEDVYADIGIGMIVNYDADGNPVVDATSTIKQSYSALDALGYGKSAEGYSNNVITLLYDVANTIRTGDRDAMASIEGFLQKRYKESVVNLTEIGATTRYLDDCTTRMNSEIDTLKNRQNEVEAVDYASEIIDEQTFYNAYQITLQMGSSILPTSIFQYI